jgi:hypothetical protein
MRHCLRCETAIPIKALVNGKKVSLQRRLYCLVCSPYGKHNTKKLHVTTPEQESAVVTCQFCSRRYVWSRRSGHTKAKCNSCTANQKRQARKLQAIAYLGGRCCKCGYDKSPRALSFHHKNPETKLFGVSGNHCRSWEQVKTELDKCELLCANCHAELHETEERRVLGGVL